MSLSLSLSLRLPAAVTLPHFHDTMSLAGPSQLRDIIAPQFHQNNFGEELYVKNELGIKLDKGLFCIAATF